MMITILLLLFCFSQSSSTAIPLINTPGDVLAHNTSTLSLVVTPTTYPDKRSIWDIIWSCLATVFACTWVSVHPDIPDPEEKWWITALRRVELVIWTLLTPELVILWAIKQWVGARKVATVVKRAGGAEWKETHGHFIQMGGFMLYDGDKMMGTLSFQRFKVLMNNKRIDFPTITQEEIEDRSKRDGLSKLLVISQTGWFILQCISRVTAELPITELELATLAFAALNGCMYFFWWNKPFDVRSSVPVELRRKEPHNTGVETNEVKSEGSPNSEKNEVDIESEQSAPLATAEGPSNARGPASHPRITWIRNITRPLWTIPRHLLASLVAMSATSFPELENGKRPEREVGPKRVPTFYALGKPYGRPVYWTCAIGSIFGAIHCAGWLFHFPTVTELWIWRISSLYIVVYPIAWFVAIKVKNSQPWESNSPIFHLFYDNLDRILESAIYAVLVVLSILLYIIARFLLLAECLTTLRDLPPGAYDVVQWTIRIPHI